MGSRGQAARVASYAYDAWGKCTILVGNDAANSIANINPFRYRSYYYDTETGLYLYAVDVVMDVSFSTVCYYYTGLFPTTIWEQQLMALPTVLLIRFKQRHFLHLNNL